MSAQQSIPITSKVYLDLSAEMRSVIRAPLADILRGQGVELPEGVRVAEEGLPAIPGGVQDKDWGTVLAAAPELILALGTAASAVILALSKFLSDRERAPKVVEVWQVAEVIGPDGSPQRVLVRNPVIVEYGPQTRIVLDAHLKPGHDLLVRFKAEV